jgi:hypothetical protein
LLQTNIGQRTPVNMPSIQTASQKVTNFPNLHSSPYGNDGVIPLYSSIPINNLTSGTCLPCVLCGNSNLRSEYIAGTVDQLKYVLPNSVSIAVGT